MKAFGASWTGAGGGRSSSVRIGINGWLISFGDLLTLLLCTFVAIISFAGLKNNPALRAKYPDSVAKSDEGHRLSDPGTQVAKLLAAAPGELGQEVWLKASDLDLAAESAAGQLKQKLELALLGYREIERVRIETCAAEEQQGAEQAWFWSMGRALQINAAFLELGVPNQKLQLRALGAECDLLGAGSAQKSALARVSFIGKTAIENG